MAFDKGKLRVAMSSGRTWARTSGCVGRTKLADFRIEVGIPQRQLAEEVGLSLVSYRRLERDETLIRRRWDAPAQGQHASLVILLPWLVNLSLAFGLISVGRVIEDHWMWWYELGPDAPDEPPEYECFKPSARLNEHPETLLAEARIKKGIPQRRLAADCGLSLSSYGRLERGRFEIGKIPLPWLANLAIALDVELLDILEPSWREWCQLGPDAPSGPPADAHERASILIEDGLIT